MVASQDPPSVPVSLIELSSQIIMHKFNSPAWLKHIQKANAALGELTSDKMSHLGTGEAYVWSSKASDESFSKGAMKVRCRPRVTQHGGATRVAVLEKSPSGETQHGNENKTIGNCVFSVRHVENWWKPGACQAPVSVASSWLFGPRLNTFRLPDNQAAGHRDDFCAAVLESHRRAQVYTDWPLRYREPERHRHFRYRGSFAFQSEQVTVGRHPPRDEIHQ